MNRGIDHLVYATPDLDATVGDLARRFGVRAAAGGRHPQWGTHNALLAIGERMYLEIVGPDPAATALPGPRPFALDRSTSPRLATWAAASADLDARVVAARSSGVDLGAITTRERLRPDGVRLAWRMTDPLADRLDGLVPFWIDWGATPHPADSAPGGVTLVSVRAEHPAPERVRRAIEALGLTLEVAEGSVPALVATLVGVHGSVELR